MIGPLVVTYHDAVSLSTCKDILAVAKEENWSNSLHLDAERQATVEVSGCTPLNQWLHGPHWIISLLSTFGQRANAEHWRYTLSENDPAQLLCYRPGASYLWHTDLQVDQFNGPWHPDFPGMVRKLSVGLELTDSRMYQGGRLEFRAPGREEDVERGNHPYEATLGTVRVWPSWVEHRVTELTIGKRFAIVLWLIGEPWR